MAFLSLPTFAAIKFLRGTIRACEVVFYRCPRGRFHLLNGNNGLTRKRQKTRSLKR